MSGDPAMGRWALMMAVRVAATLGAVLGVAIVASALWVIATVPRALAHRWRTPE